MRRRAAELHEEEKALLGALPESRQGVLEGKHFLLLQELAQ